MEMKSPKLYYDKKAILRCPFCNSAIDVSFESYHCPLCDAYFNRLTQRFIFPNVPQVLIV